jgi:hypothetical protein
MAKVSEKARDTAQSTYENAKDVAQSTYGNAKDVAQSAYGNAKDVAQSAYGSAKDVTLSTYATAKDAARSTYSNVEDNVKTGLDKTQGALAASAGLAKGLLQDNKRQAKKNLKKAQKNLHRAQHRAESGFARTQDMIGQSTQKVNKRMERAASNAKDLKESVQEQYAHYQRKRKVGRALFRWGLILGVIVTLLYTPIAGSEVRQRIFQQWQRFRTYLGA